MGLTSTLFVLLTVSAGTWMFLRRPVTHRAGARFSPTWVAVGSLLDAGHLQATSLLCFQAVLTKPCPCVCAFSWLLQGRQPRGWELWNLGTCRVREQRQGARAPGGRELASASWSWVSFPSCLSPCCFAGSEADFSSSSSTGSISAPEVHMSAAGSKRSSFSRK